MCSDQETHKQRSSKCAEGPRRKAGGSGGTASAGPIRRGPVGAAKTSGDVKSKCTEEEETYRVRHG